MRDGLWMVWTWGAGCIGCGEGFGFKGCWMAQGLNSAMEWGGVRWGCCLVPALKHSCICPLQCPHLHPTLLLSPYWGYTLVSIYPSKTHLGNAPHKCLVIAWRPQAAIWLKGAGLSGATTSVRSYKYRSVTACHGSTAPSLCSISQERATIP